MVGGCFGLRLLVLVDLMANNSKWNKDVIDALNSACQHEIVNAINVPAIF